jgi:endonuclease/exonuclease/phosphatase (EEP) superfamily protein YafD
MKPLFLQWARRLVVVLAVAYPLSLIAAAVMLRYAGEAWWLSTVALYLPPLGFAFPLLPIALALLALRQRRLLALQAVSAVVVFFPLMGFVLPGLSAVRADAGKPTMRLLSFNVNSGREGVQAVIDEIDRYSPDIVVLQEIHGASHQAFDVLLRARYPTVESTGQFAMATRYAVAPSASSPAPPSTQPMTPEIAYSFQRVVLETPLGRIVLYNVHTVSPRVPLYALRGQRGILRQVLSGRFFRGAGGAQLQSNTDVRVAQVRTFAEAAALETDPVVLAGDTNLPHLSPALHRYLSTYEDGFSTAAWGFGYTFPTDKWRPWMRIDRILAGASFRFVKFEVGQAVVSDHLCVVGDLQHR